MRFKWFSAGALEEALRGGPAAKVVTCRISRALALVIPNLILEVIKGERCPVDAQF